MGGLRMRRTVRALIGFLAVVGMLVGTTLHAQATDPASHAHAAGHAQHAPHHQGSGQDGHTLPGDCPMVQCISFLCPSLSDRQPQRIAEAGEFRPFRELLTGRDPQPDPPPPRPS